MEKKKLTLNKQRVTKLTKDQLNSVQGGKAGSMHSSWNDFTCCFCTNGGDGPSKTNNCPDYTKFNGCIPEEGIENLN